MPIAVLHLRRIAFKKQNGRCYYCGAFMWIKNQKQFASIHSLSLDNASKLQCTAEHLVAQCDGGKNHKNNIVAACKHCNNSRHIMNPAPAPIPYKEIVERSVADNQWFDLEIINSMFKTAPYREEPRSVSCPSA